LSLAVVHFVRSFDGVNATTTLHLPTDAEDHLPRIRQTLAAIAILCKLKQKIRSIRVGNTYGRIPTGK
jgi:hypothetical protein